MARSETKVGITIAAIGLLLFATANLQRPTRVVAEDYLQVVPPLPAQVAFAFGDRFLAANFAVWRAIMVGVDRLPPPVIKALADVQLDAAILNPWHEDNYYTATAILPWEGEVAKTQFILDRATQARTRDYLPPFFFGFNELYFRRDAAQASRYALVAADHATDPGDKQALTVLAAKWSEQGKDLENAVVAVRAMANNTRNLALKNYLLRRAERLDALIILRHAVEEFRVRFGREPDRLDDLVRGGILRALPRDPLGMGFELRRGRPEFKQPSQSN